MALDPTKLDDLDSAAMGLHTAIGNAKVTAAAKTQAKSSVDDATAGFADASTKDDAAQTAVVSAVNTLEAAFTAASTPAA